jgi:hypothetical protein
MTVLVSDSFNRANSTTTLGTTDSYTGGTAKTWMPSSAETGTFGINSNRAYLVSAGNAYSMARLDCGVSDGIIEVDVTWNTNSAGGLVFRYSTALRWFDTYIDSSGLKLRRGVDYATTVLGSYNFTPINGTTYRLKATINGSTISISLDGTERITATDSFNAASTLHGLRSPVAGAYLDHFVISDLNIGTPTGTDGSIKLGLTQQIYSDSSVNLPLTQNVYKDDTVTLPLTQAIYRESEIGLNLTQEIYADGQAILDLIQEFYEDSQAYITLQLIQQIYKDSSTDLPMTQAIYQDSEIGLPLRQEMYEEKEANLSLTQNVYKDDSAILNLSQSIYKDSFSTLNTVQQMYTEGEINLPLLIQIRDDLVNLIGIIRLVGKRVLNVNLQGKRELIVTLKGGIDVTAINQNFMMYAGDSKNLVVTMPEDLTGCTVKWGLRQRMYSTENLLSKTTNDGISINGTEISIKLAPEDTQTLAGTYYHECEVTDQLNNVSTIFTGMVTISRSAI